MREVTLTQIEVSGIQNYIFGSNNLKQNIGASELVTKSTTDWVVDALDDAKIQHNVKENGSELEDWMEALLPAQIVYWGGGNALILFAGIPQQHAIPFTKILTRRAIKEARGLSLVVEHQELDWNNDAVSEKHKELRKAVARRKLNRRQSTPLLGLGVTAVCDFTGLPAVGTDDENLVSQAVQHKYDAYKQEKRVNNLLKDVSGGFPFANDFNLLGERGESSYIAVIHADGNKMGQRFMAIADKHPVPADNHDYCRQLRALSDAVRKKSIDALKATVELLVNSRDPGNNKFGGVVPVPKNNDGHDVLPFRPIVFGGDDVTFVSEGRLGLALAACYLQKIGEGKLPGAKSGEDGDPLYARAGVAIVKNHYPFARAYELAAALGDSAKEKLAELTPQGKGVVLDWHFATSGVILSLAQLREREYWSRTGNNLLMRPVRLDIDAPPVGSKYWRSWKNFVSVTQEFQETPYWDERRNKVKALREPLRDGGQSVKLFRKNYGLGPLPDIPGQSMRETGWHGEDCGYFDAIEAIDFYVRLEDKEAENGQV
ncbi:MAG: hypothetical protein HF973_17410 [Chloroflexi bacterium]|nr:hypothetical protein [Chloroflexota bacterium]